MLTVHNLLLMHLRNDEVMLMPKPYGLMHLLMQIFSKTFKLLFHASHFWQMLSGTISSQPCMTWHKPWRSPLPCKRNEHANPRGSYIQLIPESMPRLVIGWSFKSILNFITSFSASQKIPHALSIGRLPVNFFLIGIHSMQGWTSTKRHKVTRKKGQKKITAYKKSV